MRTVLWALLPVLFWPPLAAAATPRFKGTSDGDWQENSVVYAQLVSVVEIPRGYPDVLLDVQATLSGSYDAGQRPRVLVKVQRGVHGHMRAVPPPKSRVVALLRQGFDGQYVIPADAVMFMPEKSAICEVKGLDDPVAQEIVSRLRVLRVLRAPEDLGPPKENVLTNTIGMKLVKIPAGEFRMGSPDSDREAAPSEKPRHRVRITRPFALGMHEVTQEQYERVMGKNPGHFKGYPQRPVDSVPWADAVEFCRRLSEKEGARYRLPTEAEWEYACRAGSKKVYAFDDYPIEVSEYAWWARNSRDMTHPVGLKKPNAWGLYDMLGNIPEWCADRYRDNYYKQSPVDDPEGPEGEGGADRVLRGGSYLAPPSSCRCAHRDRGSPNERRADRGFRVARELTP